MKKQYNQLPQVAFSILLTLGTQPRHGYDIMKQVAEDSNNKIKLGPGALYASIKQLRQQGLVEEVDDAEDSRRRYYRITDTGRRTLNAELEYYRNSIELAYKRQFLSMETFHG